MLDIARDIRALNTETVFEKKTGQIILGGGVVKHHICNANLMRNGADWSVFINTGQEFDGSDSGARPDEAVSWGKIRLGVEGIKGEKLDELMCWCLARFSNLSLKSLRRGHAHLSHRGGHEFLQISKGARRGSQEAWIH